MLCHLRSFQELHFRSIWVRLKGEPRLVCLAWCELVFLLHCQVAALEAPAVLGASCAISAAGETPTGRGNEENQSVLEASPLGGHTGTLGGHTGNPTGPKPGLPMASVVWGCNPQQPRDEFSGA